MPQKPRTSPPRRQTPPLAHAYAMILAGGSGTRFWPLSRRSRPKQLLKLFGEESLLAQTLERLHGLVPPDRTYVFTNGTIRDAVRRELPRVPRSQIIAEPASRNTAPAIGLAAYEILRRDPHGVMVILPSDHIITKPNLFQQAVSAGYQTALEEGRSVVIGIKPSRPETGFGYIRLGPQEKNARSPGIFRVVQFTEKPPLTTARRYVRSGKYLWNAGMFIWRASTLIANLERFQPQMAAALRRITEAGGVRSANAMKRLYPRLENISIDYALMEKVQNVSAVAADIGWSDVGSWAAAHELSPQDREGNVRPATALMVDSRRNIILSSQKFVAAVGVQDLVIVETEDALLICPRDRSQDVGKLVKEIERLGHKKLL
ncbi:MAG: mannose-1-phosphate guanylyltransferase [Terriglobia bacterium]